LVNEILENAISSSNFKLSATDYQSNFDSESISPQLVEAFKNIGFTLTKSASISTDSPEKWLLTDIGSRFLVIKKSNELIISFFPQTGRIAHELAANPEHLNIQVYEDVLRTKAVYPWQLPFDLFCEEVRTYLKQLGIDRYKLMQAFPKPAGLPPFKVDIMIACEYLGLTPKELDIITGTSDEEDWEFWGYTSGDPWVEELHNVRLLMDKSGLSYQELDELLKMRYVDPTNSMDIEVDKNLDIPSTCDTNKLVLANLTGQVLNRIHNFVRLWRKIGWTMREIDKAIFALKSMDINDDFVLKLYPIQRLHNKLKVPVATILSWYSNIDIFKYENESKSLYEELFQNPAVAVHDPDPFLLDLTKPEPDLANIGSLTEKETIIPALIAAFGISESDLLLLMGDIQSNAIGDKELNLSNLSIIYRNVSLAKALGLSIPEFMKIEKLAGIDPFVSNNNPISVDNIKATLKLVESLQKIKKSGLGVAELEYLLSGYQLIAEEGEIVPTEESIALILDEIRKGLQKIHADTNVVQDPTGELIKKKLALLKWDNLLIQKVISVITGTADYETSLGNKPHFLDSSNNLDKALKEKLSYDEDSKKLHFIGVMSKNEKQTLLNQSNDTAYEIAINELYDNPRTFVVKNMRSFELPTFSTSLNVLPLNGQATAISIPTDLKNKVYFDHVTKQLHFVGAMTEGERKVLLELSNDIAYTAAINDLYNQPSIYKPELKIRFNILDRK
jgi:hypothetical protein